MRNLFEILKIKNTNIIQNILTELCHLFFQIENELNSLKYEKDIKKVSEKFILNSFSEGLIDLMYDYEIYLNSENNDNLKILFQLTINILKKIYILEF